MLKIGEQYYVEIKDDKELSSSNIDDLKEQIKYHKSKHPEWELSEIKKRDKYCSFIFSDDDVCCDECDNKYVLSGRIIRYYNKDINIIEINLKELKKACFDIGYNGGSE